MSLHNVWPRLVVSPVAGLALMVFAGGCTVHVHDEPRVYRSEPLPPPPEREAVVERYEPAPREAVTVYETDLNPYGHWVDVRDYGRCWVPNERPSGWRPYSVGHWVDTADGWCWVAEDREAEWGVVTYHYGRWYEDQSNGWVWVPGTTWSPAWVAWREGGGYSGWAPLPPQCGFGVNVSVSLVDRYVPRDRYSFCETRYIGEPRIREHYVRNDVTIINRTTNITNITIVNNRVVNRGVSVTVVEKASGHRVEREEVRRVTDVSEARRLRAEGKPVAYEPAAVEKADKDYRQRVERRATDTKVAEKQRVDRRQTDAEAAKQAEHDRVTRRATDAKTAQEQEHQRATGRVQTAEEAKAAERDRAMRRTTDAKTLQEQEHQRATGRVQTAEEAKAAERERAARRAQDAKTPETSGRTPSHTPTAAEDKAAEHERAVRRAEEAKPADEKGK